MSDAATPRRSWQMDWLALQHSLITRRKTAGISQDEAARRLGVDRRTFQRWEDGETDPSGPQLYQWCAMVGLSLTAQSRKESVVNAATDALAEVEFPRRRRQLIDALLRAGRSYVAKSRLINEVYGDEYDGGPEDAEACIHTHLSRLRDQIRPLGFTITNSRHLGYRLERVEAA